MSKESPDLERLISRYLDDEASAQDRRALQTMERSDPAVRALVDEYADLDRELGRAMRRAMGRTILLPRRKLWPRLGELAAVAAAACIAVTVWISAPRATTPTGREHTAQAGSSWFAPAPAEQDVLSQPDRTGDRPRLRVRDTDRDWIIIPGKQPGEFMVIEVNRVRTRAIAIQGDS